MIENVVICGAAGGLLFLLFRIRQLKRSGKQFEIDETARRSGLELELEKTRAERDQILDALGDPFLIVDSRSNIRFANAAAKELFRGRVLTGRSVGEAFLDPRLADALVRCLATGEPVRSRVILPQQTSPLGELETRGVNAWLIDAAKLSDWRNGEGDTRVVIRDVTAEHQLDQIRKDFVANASHELRTPLAIISGYLENLLEEGMTDDSEMARRFLLVMKKHTERISRIVEDMLVISRLESGEASAIKIEPFQLRACINDVLERLESVVQNQRAIVTVNLEDDGFILKGDRFYWTQILFNLIENALKQNPTMDLKVEVGLKQISKNVCIWVKDNGIGIPSSDLPFVFRRFYRVEKHHSQAEIKGTGLGLSIVKRAIESHNGKICVTSIPGQETKFLMTIPILDE